MTITSVFFFGWILIAGESSKPYMLSGEKRGGADFFST